MRTSAAAVAALGVAAQTVIEAFDCHEAYTVDPTLGSHCAACGCAGTRIASICAEEHAVVLAALVVRETVRALAWVANLGPDRTCLEHNCDGEIHYSGAKDPVTNEDVELGPCPEWS